MPSSQNLYNPSLSLTTKRTASWTAYGAFGRKNGKLLTIQKDKSFQKRSKEVNATPFDGIEAVRPSPPPGPAS